MLGTAGQEQGREPSEKGEVPDEHDVVRLRVEAFEPGCRLIIGSESIRFLDVGLQQSTPDLGGLACSRLAGVNHPSRAHTELLDGVSCHPGNVVDTLVGEWAFRVLVLGLRLPVLNERERHCRHDKRLRRGHRGRANLGVVGEEPVDPGVEEGADLAGEIPGRVRIGAAAEVGG